LRDTHDYYFFLSYARSDDDEVIQHFFRDLSVEVRAYAGLPADTDVGFLDVQSMPIGVTWSRELMHALADCRTFVALVSPRYQLSEPCGREWGVFASRLKMLEESGQQVPPALLPLLWLPPEEVHPVVAAVQYQNSTTPEAYHRAGLRQLIRLQRHHDDYLQFVTELAEHIVRSSRQSIPAPPDNVSFDQFPSAFHHPPSNNAVEPAADQVRFVVAAPTRADLSGAQLQGRHTDYYGQRAEDWAPYRPALDRPIAEYARAIAEERQFRAVVTDLPSLLKWLKTTPAAGQLVVLLVDPWATRLRDRRRDLAGCDRHGAETITAVMVPANADDQQTHEELGDLTDALRNLFTNRLAGGEDLTFRTSIVAHESFGADLRVVLERSRNSSFRTAPVRRRPPGETRPRPILRGP
jgi:FxsC-like protein